MEAVEDMQGLAVAMRAWWNINIKPNVPATIFLSKIIVKDMTEQFAPGIEYTAGMPLPGALDTPRLPMNVTVAVKWTTGMRGRSFRGRTYHVGLFDGCVQNDTVKPDTLGALVTGYTALLEVNSATLAGQWLVVSR